MSDQLTPEKVQKVHELLARLKDAEHVPWTDAQRRSFIPVALEWCSPARYCGSH